MLNLESKIKITQSCPSLKNGGVGYKKLKKMKYYNSYKEKSLREEAARCEKQIVGMQKYLTEKRLAPTAEEMADILKDENGFKRFIFENKFNGYIDAVYGDTYIPDAKINDERRPFNIIYNMSGYSSIYSFMARFNGIVSLKHVEGTKCTFVYDKDEMDTFIEKVCRMELSDDVEITLEYINAFTKFLNLGNGIDPLRSNYITKDINGLYTADADKFACDFANKL
jgi:hypothetical protein